MTDPTLDPSIVLKITPPKLRKSLLVRDRLREIRSANEDTAVFFIEAPAGYGKTSLLAQWRLDWLQSGAVVAWVTLDADDSPADLVTAIVEGLRRAAGKSEPIRRNVGSARSRGGAVRALTAVLAAIADDATPTVLIFDDCERVSDPAVLELIEYLLHNLPPNLQIAAGSRNAIPAQTADLIAHGNLRRITAAELRLDVPEMRRLLSARLGSRADADLCARLYEVTQGWPLGVQLAAAALEQASDWERALATFSASREDSTLRLFEGLVAALAPALLEFITRCALLDRLHPALCEAVTGEEDAALWLQRLVAETPLLTAIENSEWLRLHPLAHEFLRARALRLLSIAEQSDLHRRAWHWLEQHDFVAQAAHHALAAGHDEEAHRLLYGWLDLGVSEAVAQGDHGRVREMIQALSVKDVPPHPRLRLLRGWAAVINGQMIEALPEITALATATDIDPVLHREAIGLLIGISLSSDRFDTALHYAAACPGAPIDSRTMRLATCARSLASLYRGATADAQRHQEAHPDDRTFLGARVLGDIAIAASYLWEGRPRDLDRALRVRYLRLDALGGSVPIIVQLSAMFAAACWERDAREDARTLLANRLHLVKSSWTFGEALCAAYQTRARMAAVDGDDSGALALLEELASIGSSRQLPRPAVVSLVERIRLHAARQRPKQCAVLVDELNALIGTADAEPLLMPLLRLQVAMARAFAALAAGDAEAAGNHLDAAWTLARQINRVRETIQVLALRALLAERAGAAFEAPLAEALSLAEAGDMVRIFADTLPEIVELIRRWANSGAAEGTTIKRGYIDRVLAAASAKSEDSPRIAVSSGSALLTPKESEVLRLLAVGLPNKRIAANLGLSSETVKWHMKKIFTKLDAGGRQHAVDRARMLGLIS